MPEPSVTIRCSGVSVGDSSSGSGRNRRPDHLRLGNSFHSLRYLGFSDGLYGLFVFCDSDDGCRG